jgi:excisionase family DNA binding protein
VSHGGALDREELISLSEAAVEFGLSRSYLRYLVARRHIEGYKIGRNWVTTRKAVAEFARDEFKRSKDPRKYRRQGTFGDNA